MSKRWGIKTLTMETAMQKLVNKLTNQLHFSKVTDIQSVLDYINEEGLLNEKEQIIDAFEYGQINVNEDGCLTEENGAEQYYNETYNKNK
jgi:hypothetical protein